jgi:hypothetical protein
MTLSLSLRGVWFTALGVAERYDRDGLLPPADRFALMAHTDDETAEKAFVALAKKGLLDETPEGFRVHDWQDWQASKPSDDPEAVAERVRRYRAKEREKDVTPRNALQNVTESVTPRNASNANKSEIKSESEKRVEKPPVSLRSTSPRGARIPAFWPTAADLDEMNAYGASLGINAGDVASHVSEFHDYWSQATKNATSLDWVKRWKVRFGQEVRDGKVGAHPSNGRASPNGNGTSRATAIYRPDTTTTVGHLAMSDEEQNRRHQEAERRAAERMAAHG